MSDEPSPTDTGLGGSQSGDPAAPAGQSGLTGLTTALGIEPARPGHDPLLGCDIGGVTIVTLIAEGGMGRVYEGKQDKPNRIVAVKVMRPGLTSPSVLKRFEYEAEVLGRLQHPGIAHIYSVGVHQVGAATVPYFVMEYIPNAKSLTAYAEEFKLPTRQRLDLFRSVCDAVAHGHQKGVIHRDLKPSNILVDASGQPKVIDFGVARATDSDMALTTMQTDVGQLIGTLQYMSPEQLDADPNDIDVRSDVYALGVVLYELLAGKPPYDVKKKAVYEVMRIVKEEEPTPLSGLNKALRRDVGVIAGKCLEKDRGRRYSSASELSSDISRYLAGEAIQAAPPSLWDSLARLARRHRAAAAAVLAIMFSLTIAVLGISFYALKAHRAAAISQQATKVAESEATKAKQMLYLAQLRAFNEYLLGPRRTRARQMLNDLETTYRDAYGDSSPRPIEFAALKQVIDDSLITLSGHSSRVTCLAFSPDGASVATGSEDGTACLWDVVSGSLLRELAGHDQAVNAIAFSPDGTRLGTGSRDNTARLWEVASGEPLAVLRGHEDWVTTLAFGTDGISLATGSCDGTARLWNAASAAILAVLRGHDSGKRISSLAFSPTGKYLATASDDRTARIWEVATGTSIAVLTGHEAWLNAVAFSPDGTKLATASYDQTVRLWDPATTNTMAVVEIPAPDAMQYIGPVAIAFSADGTRIATGSGDGVCIWDTTTGTLVIKAKDSDRAGAVAMSSDGTRVAAVLADSTLRTWDATTGEPLAILKGHEKSADVVAFSPDGMLLATCSSDNTARIWNGLREKSLSTFYSARKPWVTQLSFSPAGTRAVTACQDGIARLWDTETGSPITGLKGHAQGFRQCTYLPDGERVVTVANDGTVRLWNSLTGVEEVAWQMRGATGHVPVAVSADGTRLASRFEDDGIPGALLDEADNSVRIWDLQTGRPLFSLVGHERSVRAIVFSKDGTRVATSSNDGTARIWDLVMGRSIITLKADSGLVSVAFSPDSTRLATGARDGVVQIWDPATGECVALCAGHKQLVYGVYFTADGARLVTRSSDGTVRLWDTDTGAMIAELVLDNALAIAVSPDGTRLAAGGSDGTVQLWGINTGDLLMSVKGHEHEILAIGFSSDGTRLATSAKDGTWRLWGLTNADIYRNRLTAAAVRNKLAPVVDEWFRSKQVSVKVMLLESKKTLKHEEWREVSNMVLQRAVDFSEAE